MTRIRPVSLWAPVVAYMVLIFSLSGMSQPPVPDGTSTTYWHGLGYFGFGLCVTRAVAGGLGARVTWRLALLAVAIGTGYGITDEFHQGFVPGRTPDVNDLYADAIGVALAVGACWAWGIIRPRPSQHGAHDAF